MSTDDDEAQKRWNAALAKLTKELVDQGMLIEAGWMGLRAAAFPRDTPTTALDAHKVTFFAGALHLWSSIMGTDGIMEPGGEPTENDERRMENINQELKKFSDQFVRRYRQAQN